MTLLKQLLSLRFLFWFNMGLCTVNGLVFNASPNAISAFCGTMTGVNSLFLAVALFLEKEKEDEQDSK